MPTCLRRSVPLVSAAMVLLLAARQDALLAGEIVWQKDFRAAAEESARRKKPMLVEVSAGWCGHCRKMLETTFTDDSVVHHVNGCFVPVVVDADAHAGLVKQLGVEGLPTTVIVSPEMKIVRKLTGYQTAAQLSAQLAVLCAHEVRQDPPPERIVPFAYEGFCLVTLLDQREYVRGSEGLTSHHRGKTLGFASAVQKRRFDADPTRYWPVADGQCVVSRQLQRTRRDGRSLFALIYLDRLWFFADDRMRQEFLARPAAYAMNVIDPAANGSADVQRKP